jgi:hypothetical protein
MSFKQLQALIGNALTWIQPGPSRTFDLVHGQDVYGRLSFQSIFGSLAIAECSDGTFSFKRQGFLQPRITIRRSNSDLDFGQVLMDGWHQGGVVHLSDGSDYQFVKMGFLHPEWAYLDNKGRTLVRVRVHWGLKYTGEVSIEPFGKDDKNLTILLLVGKYAIILMNDEASAAAGAAAGLG